MKHFISSHLVLALVLLFVCGIDRAVCATAASPSGLAGRAESVPAGSVFPGGTGQYFEWYQPFGIHQFASGQNVLLRFAVIPFGGRGVTSIGLDTQGGGTFLSINFQGGLVNGKISHNSESWSVIEAALDFGAQNYRLTVNGGDAGIFPFLSPSTSIQALRVNYSSDSLERSIAWFDSLVVSAADTDLLAIDFDSRLPTSHGESPSGKVIAATPGTNPEESSSRDQVRPPGRVSGLAGHAESIFDAPGRQYYQWYQYFGANQFASGDKLELSFCGGGAPPKLPSNLVGLRSFKLSRLTQKALADATISTNEPRYYNGISALAFTLKHNRIRLSFLAKPGATYEIQHSSDLLQWHTSRRAFAIDGSLSFDEFQPPTAQQFRGNSLLAFSEVGWSSRCETALSSQR